MKALKLSVLLLLAGCGQAPQQSSNPQIVGGVPTANQEFFAGLVNPGSVFTYCGGSFVDSKTIVTAAHCVVGKTAARINIKVGYNNTDTLKHDILKVANVIPHPLYNRVTNENDIAIIKLADYDASILKNKIVPIKFGTEAKTFANDGVQQKLTLYGTGATSSSGAGAGRVFRTVQVPTISNQLCSKLYATYKIHDSNVCAGDTLVGGIDSCQGDSGGPAIINSVDGPIQVGVVSWGIGCARASKPGVYARASSYASWVDGFREPLL